jgi:hypothetical protein
LASGSFFERSGELHTSSRCCFNRSLAYEKLGDAARAAVDRAKALQLDPTLDKD